MIILYLRGDVHTPWDDLREIARKDGSSINDFIPFSFESGQEASVGPLVSVAH